jgi:cytochrome c553
MKKIIVMATIALFTLVSIASVHAEEGNKRKGKYAYRGVYKKCHAMDASAPAKPPVNPDTKTMAQWKRVFENKDFDQFGCKQAWDELSDEDLANICAYLVSGAADSPTPAKCK